MDWIWMTAAAVLALFILALCYYFFSDYSCCPCKKERSTRYDENVKPRPYSRYSEISIPIRPEHRYHREPINESLLPANQSIKLKYAKKNVNDIVFKENGIVTLDLHNMTTQEAEVVANRFIRAQLKSSVLSFRIITGRGIHSKGGVSILKPKIQLLLRSKGLAYEEISGGGCFEIYPSCSQRYAALP